MTGGSDSQLHKDDVQQHTSNEQLKNENNVSTLEGKPLSSV